MSAKILREKYVRSFVGLKKYQRWMAWLIVSSFLVQIAISAALGSYLLALSTSPVTILASIILVFVIGTRMRGLNNILHECSHSTFSVERSDNARLGKIIASLLFSSFSDYRDIHLSHHAHLGDYEQDLDLQSIEGLRIHDPLSPRVIFRHLVNPFLGRHLPFYLGINMSTRDGRAYQVLKVALILGVGALTVFYPVTGIFFAIIPFVFVYSALNYWADCLDHAGIVSADDDLDSSRNVLAPRVIRWLMFPRNDCFHLVHHLFPHVPARHLAATHAALTDDRLYRSRSNAVRISENVEDVFKESTVPAE